MTIEEQLEAAKAENEKLTASVAKLEEQNRKVLEEKKKEAAKAAEAKELAEQAANEAAMKSGDIDAIKAAHAKELKKAQDAIAEHQARLSTLLIDNAIKGALVENNIAPQFHEMATAYFKSQSKLENGEAKFGDVALVDGIKAFVESDKGKHFVAAPLNSGANATGSNVSAKTMTKDNFELSKFAEITDPAERNALADNLNMPWLKT